MESHVFPGSRKKATDRALSPLDLALWHADTPGHPMHLGALALFGNAPGKTADAENIMRVLAERVADIPQLNMRVRRAFPPVGGAVWEHQELDVRKHLHRISSPTADFDSWAVRTAGELTAHSLRREAPPWDMHLLLPEPTAHTAHTEPDAPAPAERARTTGPTAGTTSFAVLVRMQHALADGMGAVALGSQVLDPLPARLPERAQRPTATSAKQLPLASVMTRVAAAGAAAARARSRAPRGLPSLTAPPSGTRRFATAVVGLDDVRRIRRATGGTPNDVMLAVVAGALRRWMLHRGDPLPGVPPRALIPVMLRTPGRRPGSGNDVSALLLDLPVAERGARARLAAVRRDMERLRAAGPDRGIGSVAVLLDRLPEPAVRLGGPVAARTARLIFDVAVTSVRLAGIPRTLAGFPLRAVYPMAPLPFGHSLAVALAEYAGRVHVGLLADGAAVPDLAVLAACFDEELAELLGGVA